MKRIPIVQTINGKAAGEWRDGIAIFRGIPYGDEVDKDRRFLPALPAKSWTGVRDCTKNGPIAVQYGTSISGSGDFGVYFSGRQPEKFGCEDEIQSENCLVLNVLTPGLDDKKRPVLFYIHGGGFASGSGTLVLGADQWCREEDLVVVGINHRLNVFGSLYLGNIDEKYKESGMCGMLDIVLALEWVRDNIEAFGGDPDKVTIMGESGGGMKVSLICAMERAKNLFRYAIVESGSSAPGTLSKEQAAENTEKLLNYLGIKKEEYQKLLELPASDILEASVKCGADGRGFGPSADDINVFYNPEGAFFEVAPEKPLLVGASEEETGAFMNPKDRYSYEELRRDLLGEEDEDNEELSENGKKNWGPKVKKTGIVPAFPGLTQENVDQLIRDFTDADPDYVDPQQMLLRIQSMGSFLGANAFIHAMDKAGKHAGAVYAYLIAFDAPHPRYPEHRYAWHTADLPLQMRIVPYIECEKVSKDMAHAWAAFIRTGNPSTEDMDWPEFTVEEKKTMVIDNISCIREDPTKAYREAIAKLTN